MKVTGFTPIKSGSGVKKRGSTSAVGSFADLLGLSDTADTSSATASSSVSSASSINNLLSLQEIQDDGKGNQKAMEQGHDMLDSLEQLRHSILTGSIPVHILRNINNQLAVKKQYISDPRLMEIIEDIELRASVELAKIETAMMNRRAGRDDLLSGEDIEP